MFLPVDTHLSTEVPQLVVSPCAIAEPRAQEHHGGLGDPKVDDRLMNQMKQAGEVKFKEQQKEGDLPKDQTEINLL